MQAIFLDNQAKIDEFVQTISKPRLSKYLYESKGNLREALQLYHWNSQLAQALYLPLQNWEIALRNKLNGFLCWKYNSRWPFDDRATRSLAKSEKEKLQKTIARQASDRGIAPSTDQIVADLSAGFWVALLGSKYDVPFSWRYNLRARVLKHDPSLDRQQASKLCDGLLDLRNRVAHHEPIFHLGLEALRNDLDVILQALCPDTQAYMASACSFSSIWTAKPSAAGSPGQLALGQ